MNNVKRNATEMGGGDRKKGKGNDGTVIRKKITSFDELEGMTIDENNLRDIIVFHGGKEAKNIVYPNGVLSKIDTAIYEVVMMGSESKRKEICDTLSYTHIDLLVILSSATQYVVMEYLMVTTHRLICRSEDDKMIYALMRNTVELKPNNGKTKTMNFCLKGCASDYAANIKVVFFHLKCKNGAQFGIDETGKKSGKKTNLEVCADKCTLAFAHASNVFIRDLFLDYFYEFIDKTVKYTYIIPQTKQPYYYESKGAKKYEWNTTTQEQYTEFFRVYPKKRFTGTSMAHRQLCMNPPVGWSIGKNGAGENNLWNSFSWFRYFAEPVKEKDTKRLLASRIEYLSDRKFVEMPDEVNTEEMSEEEASKAQKQYMETVKKVRAANKWYVNKDCWDWEKVLPPTYDEKNYYDHTMNLGTFTVCVGDEKNATLNTDQAIVESIAIEFCRLKDEIEFKTNNNLRQMEIDQLNKKTNTMEKIKARVINAPVISKNNTTPIIDKNGREFNFYNGAFKGYYLTCECSWAYSDIGAKETETMEKLIIRRASVQLYVFSILVLEKATFGSSDVKGKEATKSTINAAKEFYNQQDEDEENNGDGGEGGDESTTNADPAANTSASDKPTTINFAEGSEEE